VERDRAQPGPDPQGDGKGCQAQHCARAGGRGRCGTSVDGARGGAHRAQGQCSDQRGYGDHGQQNRPDRQRQSQLAGRSGYR